jgi:DNA-binding helix-hairpin-helix protein with protein kinase domain
MPKVSGMRVLIDIYTPRTRKRICPGFDYKYLHHTAYNLAAVFRSLHAKGYVVGDVKEANVLVSDSALVTVVDTDSFQVCSGPTVYPCPVATPEYTPPEAYLKNSSHAKLLSSHDLFGLAVLIYSLLMEGVHPFAGVFKGSGEPPEIAERIRHGYFAHAPGSPIRPSDLSLPFKVLDPQIQALFLRCFVQGHSNPQARPTAMEWQNTIGKAIKNL